jgi:TonB family protein
MGSDHENYLGALMGTSFGPNFGFDGLGMMGTGDGGDGDGEGTIGLGPGLYTKIGHGAYGGPDGVGYCPPGKVCGGGLKTKPGGKVPPKVKIKGEGHVIGCIGKDVIRRVIRQHINEVRFCYEKGLVDKPDLEGRVNVGFVIKGDGAVGSAKIKNSTLGNQAVESCIASAVERWSFPAPEGCGVVIVSYPFSLVPASG